MVRSSRCSPATIHGSTVADSLDKIKELCYRYATQSGLTISIEDVKVPASKAAIVARHEADAEKAENQFKRGIITDDERRQKEIEIWTTANSEVGKAMEETLRKIPFNPLDMMVDSGARGNPQQVRQIAGMKGLVSNPRGEMIPRPIVSSFREGLSVLEYFISTHGARKGLADTALRTADSGYLTRRLVDVAQELIVREDDCGSTRGIWVRNVRPDDEKARYYLETRLDGRVLSRDVTLSDGTELAGRHPESASRSWCSCATTQPSARSWCGPCSRASPSTGFVPACYGRSLAADQHIELGEAVGVIAAQSIGEPGTQLTMRTFHTGGIAGEDITHGLPRVVELFEARTPKGAAVLARTSGVVRITEEDNSRRVAIVGDDGSRGRLHGGAEGQACRGRPRRCRGRRRGRPGRRATGPQGSPGDQGHPRDPAVPGRRGPAGLPRPGRVDPRQAHRAHRAPDAAPGPRSRTGRVPVPPGRACRRPLLRGSQPRSSSSRASGPRKAAQN